MSKKKPLRTWSKYGIFFTGVISEWFGFNLNPHSLQLFYRQITVFFNIFAEQKTEMTKLTLLLSIILFIGFCTSAVEACDGNWVSNN